MRSRARILMLGLAVFALAATGHSVESVLDDTLYAEPTPRDWKAPAYPPEALKAEVEGRVTVAFVVDPEGRVVDPVIRVNKQKPVDPILHEAVLAAAKLWTFGPALNAGKPVPRAVAVTVGFYLKGRGGKPSVDLPREPSVMPTRPAKARSVPDAAYPDELMPRKLPGRAEFEFQVTAEGTVGEAKVLFASDVAFAAAGLEVLGRWTFEPARQGPLPVISSKKSPMEFFVEGDNTKPADILAANGIMGPSSDEVDRLPEPVASSYPSIPGRRRWPAKPATPR